MCNFKSGLIFKNRVVLAPIYNESHSALLKSMNIEDSHLNASKMFVRAELIPKNNDKTLDVSEWRFKVDQDIVPDWYEEDQERYEEEFRDEVKTWIKDKFEIICGKLCVKIKSDENATYYMTVDKLFSSEFGKTNNYEVSYVREKLNTSDFANALKKEFGDGLIPIRTNLLSMDGLDDYGTVSGDILALRTFDLNRECRKNIPNLDEWEWLATPDSTPSGCGSGYVQYVRSGGCVDCGWCDDSGAVRPFFILKSSIFVSCEDVEG